ncbi:MAG: hypothetical protein ABI409_03405 [Ramlibacter sp.]
MATGPITYDNLGDKMFEAAKTSFGSKFAFVKAFLRVESEKLAITLRMIVEASATGEISRTEAKILVNMQKVAASAVLTAAEGMTAVAVQAALDAALNVAKDFVNGKIGFALL